MFLKEICALVFLQSENHANRTITILKTLNILFWARWVRIPALTLLFQTSSVLIFFVSRWNSTFAKFLICKKGFWEWLLSFWGCSASVLSVRLPVFSFACAISICYILLGTLAEYFSSWWHLRAGLVNSPPPPSPVRNISAWRSFLGVSQRFAPRLQHCWSCRKKSFRRAQILFRFCSLWDIELHWLKLRRSDSCELVAQTSVWTEFEFHEILRHDVLCGLSNPLLSSKSLRTGRNYCWSWASMHLHASRSETEFIVLVQTALFVSVHSIQMLTKFAAGSEVVFSFIFHFRILHHSKRGDTTSADRAHWPEPVPFATNMQKLRWSCSASSNFCVTSGNTKTCTQETREPHAPEQHRHKRWRDECSFVPILFSSAAGERRGSNRAASANDNAEGITTQHGSVLTLPLYIPWSWESTSCLLSDSRFFVLGNIWQGDSCQERAFLVTSESVSNHAFNEKDKWPIVLESNLAASRCSFDRTCLEHSVLSYHFVELVLKVP